MNIDQQISSLKYDRHILKMRLNFGCDAAATNQIYKDGSEIANKI